MLDEHRVSAGLLPMACTTSGVAVADPWHWGGHPQSVKMAINVCSSSRLPPEFYFHQE